MVLSFLKEILILEFLNNLIMHFVCHPSYVNLAHFVFVCVLTSFCFCVCVSVIQVILFKILTSYLLLCSICFIVSYSFLLFVLFIGYVKRWFIRYLIAASLCTSRWQESLGMMMSVAVGFLYMLMRSCDQLQK